jgi:hypothetical protein
VFISLFGLLFGLGFLFPIYQTWARFGLVALPGVYLLLGGLIPFFPGYQRMKADDPTPMVSYVLRSIVGISVILGAIALLLGWPAQRFIFGGMVVSCVVMLGFVVRLLLIKLL